MDVSSKEWHPNNPVLKNFVKNERTPSKLVGLHSWMGHAMDIGSSSSEEDDSSGGEDETLAAAVGANSSFNMHSSLLEIGGAEFECFREDSNFEEGGEELDEFEPEEALEDLNFADDESS